MLTPNVLVVAFWLGLLPSLFITGPIFNQLLRMKARQTVSKFAPEGHQAKQGTPTMGGLIILVASVFGILALVSTRVPERFNPIVPGFWLNQAAFLMAAFGAIGFIDDYLVPRILKGKRGLGWKQKLALQIIGAVAAAWWMCNGFNLQMAVVTLMILFFSNAYNFADGLDWLAGTLLFGFAAGILGMAFAAPTDWTAPIVMVIVCAAAIPFMFLNAPPAKLFMGDAGSLPIGAVMGACVGMLVKGQVSSIKLTPGKAVLIWNYRTDGFDGTMALAILVLSVVMIAELLPPPIQIFWVKVFKKRLFSFTPIHHAFEKAGWKETHVVALFAATQFVLSWAAITIIAFENPHAAIAR